MAKKKRLKRPVKVKRLAVASAFMDAPPAAPHALPDIGFVRLPIVLAHVGLGKSTLWQMVRDKEFPAPIRLSERNVGWDVNDLRSWISGRIAAAASKAA